MSPVYAAGVGLWTPGYPSPRAWIAGEPDADAARPPAALLSSRIGRYAGVVTRLAVEALEQAATAGGADLARVPAVFGSAYGEIGVTFLQLDMIEQEGVPSPARFKNSVHNTASGHVSIAAGNMGFSTALAAGGATFAMSLLEAWCWLDSHGGSILVAVADEPLPDHLSAVRSYESIGAAVLLSAIPEPGQLGRLTDIRRRGLQAPAGKVPDRLRQNPCAAALPLVEALLRETTGPVRVELDGEGWCVDLDFEGLR